jgi:FAD/FMN-containing dehydrogenase
VDGREKRTAEHSRFYDRAIVSLVSSQGQPYGAGVGVGVLDALRDGLPAEIVVDDPDRMESYRYDRALFCPAGMPAAVVLARERSHVEHTLRTASRLRVPVVAQGARSGLSGAANAIDGCIFDASDEDESRRARQAFGAAMDLGLELGGTITGEHGVGVLKKEWLERELGPVGLRLHRDIKRVLDPNGILNRARSSTDDVVGYGAESWI